MISTEKKFNYKYTISDIVWNVPGGVDISGLPKTEIFYSKKRRNRRQIAAFLNWGRADHGISVFMFTHICEPSDV